MTRAAPGGGWTHLSRLFRYIVVGGIATAIQYAILILLVRGWAWPQLRRPRSGSCSVPASTICSIIALPSESNRPHGPAAAKFAVLAGTGLLINAAIMHLMTGAGAEYLIAQACATSVVLFFGFISNTIWTFGAGPVEQNAHGNLTHHVTCSRTYSWRRVCFRLTVRLTRNNCAICPDLNGSFRLRLVL